MNVLLTYDVKATTPTIHTELKARLIDNYGYSSRIQADNGNWYALPNTTLRKSGTTQQQAALDFLKACREVDATWEKYIAAEYSGATFDNQR